ncbi:hypothetical protein MNV_660015 [Candidatus Methanoperedens nitroreducens]|uniref:Uncharacterized protein n=1 Tax=Candidatus Methanoperedens nitratireducens TaxID=1392998 RepID=A0A284VSW4_9EURY|nr:hypothetical protein MNV_660015 [Candidatus Methanoperedens nitroreducens]
MAKQHQIGRVGDDTTTVGIDFTEGWFRELLKL